MNCNDCMVPIDDFTGGYCMTCGQTYKIRWERLLRRLEAAENALELYHNCADIAVGDKGYGEYRRDYPEGAK